MLNLNLFEAWIVFFSKIHEAMALWSNFCFFKLTKKHHRICQTKKILTPWNMRENVKNFKNFFLVFFFVEFKISSFLQKELYNHKSHRQGTLGSQLQICRRSCHKNQYLLIFDNFWKNLWFPPKFSFFEARFWDFKILGNRQTQKMIFSSDRKVHGDYISYL